MDFVDCPMQKENLLVKVQFWDTAGSEKYRSIPRSFYNKVDGIILVYDISDLETFDKLDD